MCLQQLEKTKGGIHATSKSLFGPIHTLQSRGGPRGCRCSSAPCLPALVCEVDVLPEVEAGGEGHGAAVAALQRLVRLLAAVVGVRHQLLLRGRMLEVSGLIG